MILGLTGGIASGKSTVSEIFQKLGATIIDADKISREVSNSVEVVEKVGQSFGDEAILDGKLNREKLREIIFENQEKRTLLNNIMHPIIVKEIEKKIEKHKCEKLIVLDIPLLFEIKLEYLCDKTLVIWVEEKIQIKRMISRDEISLELAKKIINSQMKLEKKLKLANYNIENNSSIESLEEELKKLIKIL